MKILSGFAVINDTIGKRVAYTYSEVDEKGMVIKSNVKENFIVIEDEIKSIIEKLEDKVKEKMNIE